MTCPTCKAKFVYRATLRADGKWYCQFCPNKPPKISRIGLGVRAVNSGSVGKRTVAHDIDISRRRLAEDGRTVIRV